MSPARNSQHVALLRIITYMQQCPFDDTFPLTNLPWSTETAAILGQPAAFLRQCPYLLTVHTSPSGTELVASRTSKACVAAFASVAHHTALFLSENGGDTTLEEIETALLWSVAEPWAEPLALILRRTPRFFDIYRRDGCTRVRLKNCITEKDTQPTRSKGPVLTHENVEEPSPEEEPSPPESIVSHNRAANMPLGDVIARLVTAISTVALPDTSRRVPIKFLAKYSRWRRSQYGDLQRFLHRFPTFFELHGDALEEVCLTPGAANIPTEGLKDELYQIEDPLSAQGMVRKVLSNFPLCDSLPAGSIDWSAHASTFGRLHHFLASYPQIFDLVDFPQLHLKPGAEELVSQGVLGPVSQKMKGKQTTLPGKKQFLVVPRNILESELPFSSLNEDSIERAGQQALQSVLMIAPDNAALAQREAFRARLEEELNERLLDLRLLHDPPPHVPTEAYQCQVWLFGSTATGLFRPEGSDVDLAVLPVDQKATTASHFRERFNSLSHHWLGASTELSRLEVLRRLLGWIGCPQAEIIATARVPIIQARPGGPRLSGFDFDFDVTVRGLGVRNSLLVRSYFEDKAHGKLLHATCLFICSAAKRHGAVNSPAGLLSAYALTLMVIYFFHVARGLPLVDGDSVVIQKPPPPPQVLPDTDHKALGRAVTDCLQYYISHFDPDNDCVCVDARLHSGTGDLLELKQTHRSYICVADPYEHYFNLARHVDAARWKYCRVAFDHILAEVEGTPSKFIGIEPENRGAA
eukprot:TRINITY_DN17508_c0_g1_i1.p1 TRINITY_DN17508_c0_g1~~TRINITY_DN17508_c0_g1_i1.p1  ORF type:complete len:752 (-),score=99.91 TRINITY_DN17508_c0_g1_i1:37-2292(-)